MNCNPTLRLRSGQAPVALARASLASRAPLPSPILGEGKGRPSRPGEGFPPGPSRLFLIANWYRVGLPIDFHVKLLKDGIRRLVNELKESYLRAPGVLCGQFKRSIRYVVVFTNPTTKAAS